MHTYEIKEISPSRLAEFSEQWRELAGEDEYAVELAEVITWCGSNLQKREGYGQAVELHNTDTGEAVAILELVDSPRRSMSKLLKLWIAPHFWGLDLNDQANVELIADIYAGAFVGVIESGFSRDYDDVKIYGRTNLMLHILTYLADHWCFSGTSATLGGRWLSVSLEKEGN